MDNEKNVVDFNEILMNNFEQVKQKAVDHLMKSEFIKEESEINIKNVIRYNKDVELIKKDSDGKEKKGFKLYVVEWENNDSEVEDKNKLTELKFLVEEDEKGNIINIHSIEELINDYEEESFKNIKDVIDKTRENEEKPEEEQDEELRKDSLEDLEKEQKEDKKKEEQDKKETKKNDKNIERKPKYIIQTIDTDSYSDNIETIHRAFRLPPNVKKLAFAYPNKEDKRELGTGVTLYMLDENDNIVGDTKEYFKIDDATGKNPIDDNNTELELDKTGERHEGKTMRRFRSTQRPDQYLSVKQKEVGQYNEVYADRKEETENSSIGNQVETRNVEVQTSLEMQTINSTYKGVFHPDDIDKEVDYHDNHKDDIDNTSKKNIDGLKHTKEPCEKNIYLLYECVAELKENDEYIKKNFSDENIVKTLVYNIDRDPSITREELIKETSNMFHNSKKFKENEYKDINVNDKEKEENNEFYRDGPWSSAKH